MPGQRRQDPRIDPSAASARRPGRSSSFLLSYALAYAGAVIAYLPLLTVLLPIKVEAVAGAARLGVLTATVIAGALAASGSNILFGWLSDRTVARGGGRRTGIAAGLALLAAGCALVALANSPLTLVLAIMVFQAGVNAVLAPLLALMADEIPDTQKGVAGGLMALGNPVASAWSILVVGLLAVGPETRFALVPLASAACLLPLLLLTRAQPAGGAPPPADPARPPSRRDLTLAWSARLLVQVAGNALSLYLLYFFESVAPGRTSEALAAQMSHLMTVAFLIPLPIAVLAGRLSDRTRRPRTFLLAAAAAAALGLVGMATAQGWWAGAIGFAVYAAGSTVFLALHAGFAMQLLPDPRHRGRDLGLLNLANTLPALVGPLLAWLLATPRDFDALLLVLAGLTLAGGLVILTAQGRQ